MRAIDRFRKRFPPPRAPLERGVEDEWPVVQRRMGSVLPRDYKDFINAYGTVVVCGFLKPYNPFSKYEHTNLHWQMGAVLAGYREEKAEFGLPHALWSEPDGLLPWADTIDADTLFWHTKGHPDQWTVVFDGRHRGRFEPFDGSMVEFLDAFMRGKLDERFELGEYADEPSIMPLRPVAATKKEGMRRRGR